ncbi:MAG: Na+/H+ antiporter subunit E [Gammaproteobacteria bacterium]|nr:Na+/H+ antiporter subunit E [Gammaproteobacteria bacterium]
MSRALPHPLLSAILLVLWLLLVNELSVGHLLLGALLGWAVPLYTARFWPETVTVRRPWVLLRFVLVVLYDIVVANITVARLILGSTERLRPAYIVMPLEVRSELAISLLANTISLTPGTVSAFLSADRRCLVIHSLHTTDAAEVVATIRERYEQPLKEALETC